MDAQLLDLRSRVNDITVEVRRLARRLDVTAFSVANLEIKLTAAAEDVKATRELHDNGRITSFELTRVEGDELNARVALIGAKLAYARLLADLDLALGRSSDWVPNIPTRPIEETIARWAGQPAPVAFDLADWLAARRAADQVEAQDGEAKP